jgi:HSP20 family protein
MEELLERYNRSSRKSVVGKQHEGMLSGDWMPAVDITEDKDSFKIKVELPGVDKKDVSVAIENGVLTIKGEKQIKKEEKDNKTHRVECSYGSFIRSFTLPKDVESDKTEASFKDGILYLTLPKSEEVKPKQIDVKID